MDNEWLKTAIRLSKLGKKQEAQEILLGLVKRDPTDFQAWLWLADAMATKQERVDILREALVHNPNNGAIRQGLSNLGENIAPPEASPKKLDDAKPGVFSISMSELQSLDQRIDRSQNDAREDDWLHALSESKPSAADVSSTQLAGGKPEPGPAQQDLLQPEKEIRDPAEGSRAADFLDMIHRREGKAPAEVVRPEPVKPILGQKANLDASDKENAEDGTLPIDGLEYQIVDHSRRRRWLGIIFILVLLGILAAAVYLAWPTIWGTVSPMIAAMNQPVVVAPTATPTQTLPPTETPTVTPTNTPRPTNTHVPTVAPTVTPIPPILNAVLVEPENIQQFKQLGMVGAHGTASLTAHLLAETVDDSSVQIWDFLTSQPLIKLSGPTQHIQQSAISADGKWAAAVSEEPAVWVWDIETGKVIANLTFSADLVARYTQSDFPKTLQIQFSPDEKAVFVTSMMGVSWWDLTTKQERHLFPLLPKEYEDFRQQALQPDTKTATSFLLSFSPDGKAFAVGSQTKVYILIWPGAGGRATLNTGKPLIAMHWMDNGLLGLTHPGQVSVWNTYFNKLLLTFPGLASQPAGQPPAAAFRVDGQGMAIEVDSPRNVPGVMMLKDLPLGGDGLSFDTMTFTRITDPMFSLDGTILFGSSGGDLFVWDTSSGKTLRRIANRQGFIEMSPDGKYFLEVSASGTYIWGIQQ